MISSNSLSCHLPLCEFGYKKMLSLMQFPQRLRYDVPPAEVEGAVVPLASCSAFAVDYNVIRTAAAECCECWWYFLLYLLANRDGVLDFHVPLRVV